MNTPPAAPPPAAPSRPRRSWFGAIATILGPALALILAVAVVTWWMATTSSGLRAAAALASAIVPGLTLDGVDGSLARSMQIARFELDRGGWSVKAEGVDIELRDWSLSARRLDAERITARRLQIDWQSSGAPNSPPTFLGLPFELIVRQAGIQELALGARGSTPLVFRHLDLIGRMDPQGIEIERILGDFDRTRIEARGRIAAAPPFVTQATAQLGTTVQNRAITATVTASGSLQQLQLHLQADDTAARATASGTLRAFDAVLFQRQ
jgi:hypothetical protein